MLINQTQNISKDGIQRYTHRLEWCLWFAKFSVMVLEQYSEETTQEKQMKCRKSAQKEI